MGRLGRRSNNLLHYLIHIKYFYLVWDNKIVMWFDNYIMIVVTCAVFFATEGKGAALTGKTAVGDTTVPFVYMHIAKTVCTRMTCL